jgi:hypothetical protein
MDGTVTAGAVVLTVLNVWFERCRSLLVTWHPSAPFPHAHTHISFIFVNCSL